MTRHTLLPALPVLALMFAGCSTPPENPQLVEAREAFSALQAKPQAYRLAAFELHVAHLALLNAEDESLDNHGSPEVEHLAYLANREIETAEQTIVLRQAEAGMRGIEARRTEARLEVRTAQLNALKALNGRLTQRGTVVTFGDVLFGNGRAELRGRSQGDIQQLVRFLRDNPERKVRVEGFTDATGSDAFNQRLSENRAAAVVHALRQQGIDPSRIVSVGYGKEYPVASNRDAQSRQLNRRVEVVVSQGADAVKSR